MSEEFDFDDYEEEEEIDYEEEEEIDEEEDEENDELDIEEDEIMNEVNYIINNNDNNDDKKTTFNILTKYEKNFILGFRAQQIINGSPILIDINKLKNKDIFNIVNEELKQKRIPFKIKRVLPNNKVEFWDLEDMIIL